jgi:hypothetical protein
VRELCDEILSENMDEEAKLSMDEFDYNVWKMWVVDPSLGAIPDERKPQIDATYDMAWQSGAKPIRPTFLRVVTFGIFYGHAVRHATRPQF